MIFLQEEWPHRIHFEPTLIFSVIGLRAIWDFPSILFRNGGSRFFLSFMVQMISFMGPMLGIEIAIGQYLGATVPMWSIVGPIVQGISYGQMMLAFTAAAHIAVPIAYCLYYLYLTAFSSNLEVITNCNNSWNSKNCSVFGAGSLNTSQYVGQLPTNEFFKVAFLNVSQNLDESGSIRSNVVFCLFLVWICVFLFLSLGPTSICLMNSIAMFGFYITLGVFCGLSGNLPGASLGEKQFFKPENTNTTMYATDSMHHHFYSFFVGLGVVPTLASYNGRHRLSWLFLILDVVVIVVFYFIANAMGASFTSRILGYGVVKTNLQMEELASTDVLTFAFSILPSIFAIMPHGSTWAGAYFCVLFLAGIGNLSALLEVVVKGTVDSLLRCYPLEVPQCLQKVFFYRPSIVAVLACISFLFGLLGCSQRGLHVFRFVDHYIFLLAPWSFAVAELLLFAWLITNRISYWSNPPAPLKTWILTAVVLLLLCSILGTNILFHFAMFLIDFKFLATAEPTIFSPSTDKVGWFLASSPILVAFLTMPIIGVIFFFLRILLRRFKVWNIHLFNDCLKSGTTRRRQKRDEKPFELGTRDHLNSQ